MAVPEAAKETFGGGRRPPEAPPGRPGVAGSRGWPCEWRGERHRSGRTATWTGPYNSDRANCWRA